MINDASVVIGGGNWGIKEADVLGYKLINGDYYAREIDFANSTAAGTYTDSTGVIRKAPYNLLLQSNTFDTTWTNIGSSETSGQAGYDGTNNAWSLVEDSAGGAHTLVQIPSTFGLVTLSVYAKAGTRNWLFLRGVQGGLNVRAWFNLSTGTIGTVETNGTARIASVGNGWYRCSLTIADFQSGFEAYIALSNADAISGYTGNGTGNILIQSAQLVQGTEALPYFPTTTRLNVPRIDYRNADGSLSTVGRLLLEPQRTNSLFYSEQFDNAYFAKGNSSILANAAISPSGNQDADKLVPDTSNSIHSVNKSSQSIVGGIYSVFAKADGYDWILLTSHSSSSPPTRGAFFNVNNGTVGTTGAGVNANIQNYGNGWYRCSISEGNSPSSIWTVIATNADNVITFTGNGTDGVLIWGGQNEQGTYPTTYIPTTTAAVTRNADSASRTGVESWIGQTEGVLFMDVNLDTRQSYTYFAVAPNLASTTTYIGIGIASNLIQAEVVNSGVQVAIVSGNSATGRFKIAFAYKQNDFAFYINGALIGTDTSGTVPACSQIGLYNYSQVQMLKYNQALLFKTRLTNEQLSQLTTL